MNALATTTITISLTDLVLVLLGVLAYLTVGALLAQKLAINTGAAAALCLFWPAVLIFLGLYQLCSLVFDIIPQKLAGDRCRCPASRLNTNPTYEVAGAIRCTRCGYLARETDAALTSGV